MANLSISFCELSVKNLLLIILKYLNKFDYFSIEYVIFIFPVCFEC